MNNKLPSAQTYSHLILSDTIQEGDFVIDATMGNGHDTLFLSNLVGPKGHVFAYDIQQLALDKTQALLDKESSYHNVSLFATGHQSIQETIPSDVVIHAAIFNLGYLPGSDKSITTSPLTTIAAIEQILERLTIGGSILIVVYDGHAEGKIERVSLMDYLSQLDQKKYNVLHYEFINQANHPPRLLVVRKYEH